MASATTTDDLLSKSGAQVMMRQIHGSCFFVCSSSLMSYLIDVTLSRECGLVRFLPLALFFLCLSPGVGAADYVSAAPTSCLSLACVSPEVLVY